VEYKLKAIWMAFLYSGKDIPKYSSWVHTMGHSYCKDMIRQSWAVG